MNRYLPSNWKPEPRTVVHPGGPWWPRWMARLGVLGRWVPLVVVAYLVGQSYTPGSSHRQCRYESTRGVFYINVQAVRDCPLTINIKEGEPI